MQKIEILDDGNMKISIPITLSFKGKNKRKCISATHPLDINSREPSTLLKHIARAMRWQQLIDNGTFKNIKDIAEELNLADSNIASIMRVAYLSPRIIHLAIENKLPFDMEVQLTRKVLPLSWAEQEKFAGLDNRK